MKKPPVISVLIPTYNSAKTIKMTLESIRKQSYPQNRIQIIVVDGGSNDSTLTIAKRYGCEIVNNPKTDIVNAEFLGYKKATGKYLVGLAPDEVLENKHSLEIKLYAINNKRII